MKKLLIVKSIQYYYRQVSKEKKYRETLFNNQRTPTQAFSFLFFIVILGQIGIITSTLFSLIAGNGLLPAIGHQAISGNFLTFQISLIFSCVMFYFLEYSEGRLKELFCLRSTYLIAGLCIAFLAMLNYIFISTSENKIWSTSFVIYNISLYVLAMYVSYKIYMTFSVAGPTVTDFSEEKVLETFKRADSLKEATSYTSGTKTIKL